MDDGRSAVSPPNYLGQGALVLSNPSALESPRFFYRLKKYPPWALIPMVCLGTCATVIGVRQLSQGAFSDHPRGRRFQLQLLPRFAIRHTSESMAGQIYLHASTGFF